MSVLPDIGKSQARYHLMYNGGTPAGDRARLERSMNEIADTWTVNRITDLINRCETAYALSELEAGDLVVDERVAISGDVVRTTDSQVRDTWNKRQRYYLAETNQLARSLGVRNYRDLSAAIAGYLIEGATYINSVPGAKGETGTVSSATGLILNWSTPPETGANQSALFVDGADGVLKLRGPNNGPATGV